MNTIKSIFPKIMTNHDIDQILTKIILQESAVEQMDNDVARQTSEDCTERALKTEGGVIIAHTPAD